MSSTSETLSNLKEAAQSIISTRRPWGEFLSLYALSFPSSLSEATTRVSINLTRFLFNYSFIFLFILILSLVYHPVAILLLLIAFAGWYFLFFSRDASDTFTLFNLVTVDDRILVVILSVFVVVAISMTGVWVNVVVSVAVVAGVVFLHGALRRTDEGFADDYESPYGPMLNDSGAGPYALV